MSNEQTTEAIQHLNAMFADLRDSIAREHARTTKAFTALVKELRILSERVDACERTIQPEETP